MSLPRRLKSPDSKNKTTPLTVSSSSHIRSYHLQPSFGPQSSVCIHHGCLMYVTSSVLLSFQMYSLILKSALTVRNRLKSGSAPASLGRHFWIKPFYLTRFWAEIWLTPASNTSYCCAYQISGLLSQLYFHYFWRLLTFLAVWFPTETVLCSDIQMCAASIA